MIPPNDRSELGRWLNEHGLTGAMAEIGCAYGGFAKSVLDVWKGGRYVMVDPWMNQDPAVYRERQRTAGEYVSWYEQCAEMSRQDRRIVLLRGFSHDMAPQVPDGSLDCCYIDGNHSFEAVIEDLRDWWPKVREGGLFCGHDFYDAVTDGHYCGVESAVRRWSSETGNKFVHSPSCSSWWVVKQEQNRVAPQVHQSGYVKVDRDWLKDAAATLKAEQPRAEMVGGLGVTIQ